MDELAFGLSTRLFGRADEVDAVRALLDRGSNLVTVTGPGGVGKSRVALAAAPDDAIVVPLAATEAGGLVDALRRVFLPFAEHDDDPIQMIGAAIGTKVVILDTFEHLLSEASVLAELVKRTPGIQLIVTSRSRLRLDFERVISVGRLATEPATLMFRDRADAIGVSVDDGAEVAELCELLDGLPLAIELAAARTALFTPRQLLARLREGKSTGNLLGVLGRGLADAPDRQRSIRATIEWSYLQLDDPAAILFRRLGLFPSTFDLDTVEEVCSADPLHPDVVLDAIATLVDLHLVEPVETATDVPRFRLLDALREYAVEQWDAGDQHELVQRLIDWAVAYARRATEAFDGSHEKELLDAIDADAATLRLVLTRLAERGDVLRGLVITRGIAMSWLTSGPIIEGLRWFDRFLELDTSALDENELAVAVCWRARLAAERGDLSVAADMLAARDRITDPAEWWRATDHMAYALTLQGDAHQADELTDEAMRRAEDAHEQYWLTVFLVRKALSCWRREDDEQAIVYARRAAELARSADHARLLARAEQVIAFSDGGSSPRRGEALVKSVLASLRSSQASGDRKGAIVALAGLGGVAPRPAEAAAWYRDGLAEAVRVGYWHGELFNLFGTAELLAETGRVAEAAELAVALDPYVALVEAALPARFYRDGIAALAKARAQMGADVLDPELVQARGVEWLRERARTLAEEIAGAPSEFTAPRRRGRPAQVNLSERELEVLAAIARGGTNVQISAELCISAKTVMHHTTSVYRKLGVRGRAEAIAHAYRTGLLTATEPGR